MFHKDMLKLNCSVEVGYITEAMREHVLGQLRRRGAAVGLSGDNVAFMPIHRWPGNCWVGRLDTALMKMRRDAWRWQSMYWLLVDAWWIRKINRTDLHADCMP